MTNAAHILLPQVSLVVSAFVKRIHLTFGTENLGVEQSLTGTGWESRLWWISYRSPFPPSPTLCDQYPHSHKTKVSHHTLGEGIPVWTGYTTSFIGSSELGVKNRGEGGNSCQIIDFENEWEHKVLKNIIVRDKDTLLLFSDLICEVKAVWHLTPEKISRTNSVFLFRF